MTELRKGPNLQSSTPDDLLATITNNVGVVLEVRNHTKWTLTNARVLLNAGVSHLPPGDIAPGTREAFAMKKTDHTAKGSAGVVSWTIDDGSNNCFAIMWSAPYSFDLHTNWLGVGIVPAGLLHENTFNEMYRDHETWFHRKEFYKDVSTLCHESDKLAIKGVMGNGHKSVITVDLEPKSDED